MEWPDRSETLHGPDTLYIGPPLRTGSGADWWEKFWGQPFTRGETYTQGITVVSRGVHGVPSSDPAAVLAAGGDIARALPVAGPLRLPSAFPKAAYLTAERPGLALAWSGGTPPYDIVAEDEGGATIAEFNSETTFLWQPEWRAPNAPTVCGSPTRTTAFSDRNQTFVAASFRSRRRSARRCDRPLRNGAGLAIRGAAPDRPIGRPGPHRGSGRARHPTSRMKTLWLSCSAGSRRLERTLVSAGLRSSSASALTSITIRCAMPSPTPISLRVRSKELDLPSRPSVTSRNRSSNMRLRRSKRR